MPQTPIVLVTPSNVISKVGFPARSVNCNYTQGVAQAGGLPVIVTESSCLQSYIEMADALLLTGGIDIHPRNYNQPPIAPEEQYDPGRDEVELELARTFLQLKKPILAICRGFQILNVALGGQLVQDIPTWCGANHSGGCRHLVDVCPDTMLHGWFGPRVEVNSYHHQAITPDGLAKDLVPSAIWRQEDHVIIEGGEHKNLPAIGVQWHPERMLNESGSKMTMLFQWLVTSAREK